MRRAAPWGDVAGFLAHALVSCTGVTGHGASSADVIGNAVAVRKALTLDRNKTPETHVAGFAASLLSLGCVGLGRRRFEEGLPLLTVSQAQQLTTFGQGQ